MVKQYVGARYVPKFYQGSNGNAWDANVPYEALTIVTYLNNSYTSKIPIPANIGNPADNPTYWALTSNYSAQVEEYRETVEAYKDEVDGYIDELTDISNFLTFKKIFANKKVVIIGDSLSIPDTTWTEPFTELVESIGGTVDNRAVGGYTAAQCSSVVASLTEAYDIAIVWCGINDVAHHAVYTDYTPLGNLGTPGTFNYSYNELITGLRSLKSDMLIYTFGCSFVQAGAYYINSSLYYYNAAIKLVSDYNGAIYKNIEPIANNAVNNKSAMMPDNVHFTEAYSKSYLLYGIIDKLSTPIAEQFVRHFDVYKDDFTEGSKVTIGTVFGDHDVGHSYDATGLIIVNSDINASEEIFTANFSYIPGQTWIHLTGADNKSGIGVNSTGSTFVAYTKIDAGTYVFRLKFNPNYVNASRDQQYS